MAHLLDLPEDLVILILQYLQQREPEDLGYRPVLTNLVHFCLVSKSFVPATRRALYASFWSDELRGTWRIRAFLCTVIANPLLASHVLGVELTAWRAWDRDSDERDSGYPDDRRYSPGRNRNDRKLFQKAIHQLALSDTAFWRSAVRKDVDEVYVALLLLSLPNLRKLWLGLPLRFEVLEKALHHATFLRPLHAPLASLQKLEEFGCWFRGNVARGSINELAPFFRLPCVRKIHAGAHLVSSGPWPQLPPNTTLEYLELDYHDIQPETLGGMLHGLKSLKGFAFEPYTFFERVVFHPQWFGSALMNAAASLRDIYIASEELYCGDGTLLGSFRSFTQLKCLKTEFRWLLGDARSVRLVNILPPSLEKLALTGHGFVPVSYYNAGLDIPFPFSHVVSQFQRIGGCKTKHHAKSTQHGRSDLGMDVSNPRIRGTSRCLQEK